MACSSQAALEQQQRLHVAGCLPWHCMRDDFNPCSKGWVQGVGTVLHLCWRVDCAAPREERTGNSSGQLHAHTGIYSSCCWAESLLAGLVGGSPAADDNPCLSTHMWHTKYLCHLFFFYGTIPDCFFCSKGETDLAIGVFCTPLVLVLPLQPQPCRVNCLTSQMVSLTPPFPPSSPGYLSSPCKVIGWNRAGSSQLQLWGYRGGINLLAYWQIWLLICSSLFWGGGCCSWANLGVFSLAGMCGVAVCYGHSYSTALTGVWSQAACSSKPVAVYLLLLFNPAVTVGPVWL